MDLDEKCSSTNFKTIWLCKSCPNVALVNVWWLSECCCFISLWNLQMKRFSDIRGCPWLYWSALGRFRSNDLSLPHVQPHMFWQLRRLEIWIGSVAQTGHTKAVLRWVCWSCLTDWEPGMGARKGIISRQHRRKWGNWRWLGISRKGWGSRKNKNVIWKGKWKDRCESLSQTENYASRSMWGKTVSQGKRKVVLLKTKESNVLYSTFHIEIIKID